jgi:endonuclease/exonuclease/phosphatase (EEP) superfamily protein YafD
VERVEVPSTRLVRLASDHRPLYVDLLPAGARA